MITIYIHIHHFNFSYVGETASSSWKERKREREYYTILLYFTYSRAGIHMVLHFDFWRIE